MGKQKLTLRQITLFGILGSLTFGAKVAMAWLPNIEPVSLFVMLFAVTFGWKALYPVYLYVLLEILFYGINLWNINYLYVWAVLAVIAYFLKNLQSPIWWALIAGLYGLAFGLLCAPVYAVIGGPEYAVAWWLSGLQFDCYHAAGNFVIALVLFVPLRRLLEKLYGNMNP